MELTCFCKCDAFRSLSFLQPTTGGIHFMWSTCVCSSRHDTFSGAWWCQSCLDGCQASTAICPNFVARASGGWHRLGSTCCSLQWPYQTCRHWRTGLVFWCSSCNGGVQPCRRGGCWNHSNACTASGVSFVECGSNKELALCCILFSLQWHVYATFKGRVEKISGSFLWEWWWRVETKYFGRSPGNCWYHTATDFFPRRFSVHGHLARRLGGDGVSHWNRDGTPHASGLQ